jgi:hypothetical protein
MTEWRTKDGRIVEIETMEIYHAMNLKRFLERRHNGTKGTIYHAVCKRAAAARWWHKVYRPVHNFLWEISHPNCE